MAVIHLRLLAQSKLTTKVFNTAKHNYEAIALEEAIATEIINDWYSN